MKLAFDIGSHLGHSSRKLLDLGWDVVAVDANPHLTASMESAGNLAVLTAAVASVPGFLDFYVNDAKEDWSSLQYSIANRNGGGVRKITSAAVTLAMLAEHFGLPRYLKLDIEGGEVDAIAGLGKHRPTVISMEVDHLNLTHGELAALASELGYDWCAWSPQCSNEVQFPSSGWRPVSELSPVPSPWCDLFLSRDPAWEF